MTEQRWLEVDEYIESKLLEDDPPLSAALAASRAAGLPAIAVSPAQGKLLNLIAQVHGASSILELGTLGGYSTIWLARALPADGRLISLEVDPRHAEVATANLANAGLSDRVDVRVGPALQTLAAIAAEEATPFDLIFIDADKRSTPEYFEWALKLVRLHGVIIVDNVVRGGRLADAHDEDPSVQGMRRFHDLLSHNGSVQATTIQTVGSKGHDGFTLVRVGADASPAAPPR